MTVAAYLDWEARQELRYEFVNGHVFAMTGGSLAHNDIAINLLTALRPHTRRQGRMWLYTAYQSGDTIRLESLGFEFPVEQLYEEAMLEAG